MVDLDLLSYKNQVEVEILTVSNFTPRRVMAAYRDLYLNGRSIVPYQPTLG